MIINCAIFLFLLIHSIEPGRPSVGVVHGQTHQSVPGRVSRIPWIDGRRNRKRYRLIPGRKNVSPANKHNNDNDKYEKMIKIGKRLDNRAGGRITT